MKRKTRRVESEGLYSASPTVDLEGNFSDQFQSHPYALHRLSVFTMIAVGVACFENPFVVG